MKMEFGGSIEVTKAMLLVALLAFCSLTDLKVRRIPNAVLFPALMTSFFLSSIAGGVSGLADSIAGLIVGVLMLMPLHILGRMGAGDIKLLGVVGSVLGAWGAIVAGLATMMAGGILGATYILWSLAKPAVISRISDMARRPTGSVTAAGNAPSIQTARATEIPYAVAIAAGTVATLMYLDMLPEVIK
jgi:prepilin peptidase CpaA